MASVHPSPMSATPEMESVRCRYPSKRCENIRVLKRDGDLHRFCEFHRLKANLNQQRLEQRRRVPCATPTKRAKRVHHPLCEPHQIKVSSPESCSDVLAMPSLGIEDLDMALLEDLLDLPDFSSFTIAETQAALRLLDAESSADCELLSVSMPW